MPAQFGTGDDMVAHLGQIGRFLQPLQLTIGEELPGYHNNNNNWSACTPMCHGG